MLGRMPGRDFSIVSSEFHQSLWVYSLSSMLCDKVIRNGGLTIDCGNRTIDWIDLQWNQCVGVLKRRSRAGESVQILLPRGQVVRHHDVIYEDANRSIIVNVEPCEVIIAKPGSFGETALLALELGNLHLPVQLANSELIFIEDESAMRVLSALQMAWRRNLQRFEPKPLLAAPVLDISGNLQVVIRSESRNSTTRD
jgi:urease accessory protein UreE